MVREIDARLLENMLKKMDGYQVPANNSIKSFLEDMGIIFNGEALLERPKIRGISTSSLMKEIRSGRCEKYT